MKRKLQKKQLAIIAVCLLLIAVIAQSTVAYFTAEARARNVITTGKVDIALLEWGDDACTVPYDFSQEDIMPGEEIIKVVQVENTGKSPAWVRVKVEKNITLSEDGRPDINLITMNFNTQDWEYKEGFYYYKDILEVGEVTEALFSRVVFSSAMDNQYQNCEVDIDITAYATQTAHNGATVWDAAGWPAE